MIIQPHSGWVFRAIAAVFPGATRDPGSIATTGSGQRRLPVLVICLAAAAWAAGLLGVLSLQYLPDRFFGEHTVCGPWGCGAPLPALLACHGFWLVLFTPMTILAARCKSPRTVWRIGATLVALAGVGLVGVGVWQGLTWWPAVDKSLHRFAPQRYLFALATTVDVPVLEALLAGVTLWWAGLLRERAVVATRKVAENFAPHDGSDSGQASSPF